MASPQKKSPLGLTQNWKQFTLLVIVNAFVGGMVGMGMGGYGGYGGGGNNGGGNNGGGNNGGGYGGGGSRY